MTDAHTKDALKKGYGQKAREGKLKAESAETIGKSVGYLDEELKSAPEEAYLGLGCGNPLAIDAIRPTETIIDLGSGGGFDCFLAAQKVGPQGKVIGIDMTPEMIELARANALKGRWENVEFRLGDIEAMPVSDGIADAVISNCVISVVPDKAKAFTEAFRVLKPGGKLMISDLVLQKEIPDFVMSLLEEHIGCLSGTMLESKYLGFIEAAGFEEINIVGHSAFSVDILMNDPTTQRILNELNPSQDLIEDVASSVASIKVSARKPDAEPVGR